MRTRWDNRKIVTVAQVFLISSNVFLAGSVIIAKTPYYFGCIQERRRRFTIPPQSLSGWKLVMPQEKMRGPHFLLLCADQLETSLINQNGTCRVYGTVNNGCPWVLYFFPSITANDAPNACIEIGSVYSMFFILFCVVAFIMKNLV